MKLHFYIKRVLLIFQLIIIIFSAGCSASSTKADVKEQEFGRNVFVDGINISRMTWDEAVAALDELHKSWIKSWNYTISLDEKQVVIPASDLPISFNTESVLQAATKYEWWRIFQGREPEYGECRVIFDVIKAKPIIKAATEKLNIAPVEPTAKYSRDAEGKFVFTEGVPGKTVDIDELANIIKNQVESKRASNITAPFIYVEPDMDMSTLRASHLLMSEFTTSFASSTLRAPNRMHNIVLAARKLDGYTMAPGEELDMNAVLGDRNAENGWKKAPGIRYGKYESEYGGGVCQVSSTLFNAALLAELKITERHNHTWPVTYVPIGRDATISTGGPNFKFVNNTDSAITISTDVDVKKHKITIQIYGRYIDDGVTVKISSVQTGTIPNPGDEIVLDRSLGINTRVVERESKAGKTSKTYLEYYDSNGRLIEKKLIYQDKYPCIKGKVYVSPDIYYGYSVDPFSDVPDEYWD